MQIFENFLPLDHSKTIPEVQHVFILCTYVYKSLYMVWLCNLPKKFKNIFHYVDNNKRKDEFVAQNFWSAPWDQILKIKGQKTKAKFL